MEIGELIKAIKKSGGGDDACTEANDLAIKLDLIKSTGRYGSLLKDIAAANDASNFLSLIFEMVFAYQFESTGIPLEYEVHQDSKSNTSIDFLMNIDSATYVYFEARLIQQESEVTQNIEKQIKNTGEYEIYFSDIDSPIKRLQGVILSKVQKNGVPIKFFQVNDATVNIVAINVSDLILGMMDLFDCLLAVYGDSSVDEVYRRGIVGLFQEEDFRDSAQVKSVITDFSHFRKTVSGVLFLFKSEGSGFLNYKLEHYMMWNPSMKSHPSVVEIESVIQKAIPIRRKP